MNSRWLIGVVRLVVVFHLSRIFLANLELDHHLPKNPFGWAVVVLSDLNLSHWTFGFFGRESGTNIEITFELDSYEGDRRVFSTRNGYEFGTENVENRIRFYGFKSRLTGDDEATRSLVARSVALKLIRSTEDCHRVTMIAERSLLPDLAGERPTVEFAEFYRAEITRR